MGHPRDSAHDPSSEALQAAPPDVTPDVTEADGAPTYVVTRRSFLGASTTTAASLGWLSRMAAAGVPAAVASRHGSPTAPDATTPPVVSVPRASVTHRGTHPNVIVPNGRMLPWAIRDGVKIFYLVAEPVRHEFALGITAECWGYNGSTPGPVIEAVEGDHVRIYVTNKLPEATTIHWHGLFVPNGMDGVSGLTQAAIQPGDTFRYEFTLRQHGTFMYHPHFDEMTQMGMGMMGMFIVHPREPVGPRVDRDFAILLSEWAVKPGARRPDTREMTEFNLLTMNSRVFPGTEPLMVERGDRVRIRFGNLGAMDHHPIHLHGHRFHTTATDGGAIPESARWPEATVLVPVGSTRDIEFVADVAGDWAMHCHMTHHVMNQMGHGLPNAMGMKTEAFDDQMRTLLPDYMTMGQTGMGGMTEMGMPVPENSIPMVGGAGQFGTIDMGGMFTMVKVRDPGSDMSPMSWYVHPAGTVASAASAGQLQEDGIDIVRGTVRNAVSGRRYATPRTAPPSHTTSKPSSTTPTRSADSTTTQPTGQMMPSGMKMP